MRSGSGSKTPARWPATHGDPPLPVSPDHGLGLVDAVSARWGVQPADGGKTVWAELPLT